MWKLSHCLTQISNREKTNKHPFHLTVQNWGLIRRAFTPQACALPFGSSTSTFLQVEAGVRTRDTGTSKPAAGVCNITSARDLTETGNISKIAFIALWSFCCCLFFYLFFGCSVKAQSSGHLSSQVGGFASFLLMHCVLKKNLEVEKSVNSGASA